MTTLKKNTVTQAIASRKSGVASKTALTRKVSHSRARQARGNSSKRPNQVRKSSPTSTESSKTSKATVQADESSILTLLEEFKTETDTDGLLSEEEDDDP